jgi:hypothetical protein
MAEATHGESASVASACRRRRQSLAQRHRRLKLGKNFPAYKVYQSAPRRASGVQPRTRSPAVSGTLRDAQTEHFRIDAFHMM